MQDESGECISSLYPTAHGAHTNTHVNTDRHTLTHSYTLSHTHTFRKHLHTFSHTHTYTETHTTHTNHTQAKLLEGEGCDNPWLSTLLSLQTSQPFANAPSLPDFNIYLPRFPFHSFTSVFSPETATGTAVARAAR